MTAGAEGFSLYGRFDTDAEKVIADLGRVDKRAAEVGKRFGDTAKATDEAFRKLSQSLNTIGRSLTRTVTLPILGAGIAATKFSMDFNASMANIGSLIPGQVRRLEQLKVGVQSLSIELGKSTGDLAEGLYQVISAFGDSAESMELLRINAMAARGGVAQTTEALGLTSAVTKAYGDTTAQAVLHASDLALLTVKLGQTTFPELARSIGRVAPQAAALGLGMEELFAGFATLTGVTGTAELVSTQLRAALVGLQKPSKEMAAALKAIGFESGEAALAQLGLGGTLQALLHAVNDDVAAFTKLWTQVEAWPALAALAGGQAEAFADKLAELRESAGATQAAFDAQTSGINRAGFAWEQTRQRMTVFAQRAGDLVSPTLMKVLDHVDKLFEGLSKLSENTQKWIVIALGVAAIAGPLLLIAGRLVEVARVLKLAAAAQWLFNAAASANPYVLLATAILGAAAAIYTFTRRTREATAASSAFSKEAREQTAAMLALAKRAQELGDKTERSADEHRELNAAMDELADRFPDLVAGYDSEGNAILSLTEVIRTLNEERREQIRLARIAAAERRTDIAQQKSDLEDQVAVQKSAIAEQSAYLNEIRQKVGDDPQGGAAVLIEVATGKLRSQRAELIRLQSELEKVRQKYAAVVLPMLNQGLPRSGDVWGPLAPPAPKGGGEGGGGAAGGQAGKEPPTRLEISQAHQARLKALLAANRITWAEYFTWLAAAAEKYRTSEKTAEIEFFTSLQQEREEWARRGAATVEEVWRNRTGAAGKATQAVLDAFEAAGREIGDAERDRVRKAIDEEQAWFEWRLEHGQIDLQEYIARCEREVAEAGETTDKKLAAEQRLADARERLLRQNLALVDEEIAATGSGYQRKVELLRQAVLAEQNITDQLRLQGTIRDTAREAAQRALEQYDFQRLTLEQQLAVVTAVADQWEGIAGTIIPDLETEIISLNRQIEESALTFGNVLWQAYSTVGSAFADFFDNVLQGKVTNLITTIRDGLRRTFSEMAARRMTEALYSWLFPVDEKAQEKAAAVQLAAGASMVTAGGAMTAASVQMGVAGGVFVGVASTFMIAAGIMAKAAATMAASSGGGLLGILGFQGGGIAWRPQLAMLAEHEPEYIIPVSKVARPALASALPPVGGSGTAGASGLPLGGPQLHIGEVRLAVEDLSEWQLHRLAENMLDHVLAAMRDRFGLEAT